MFDEENFLAYLKKNKPYLYDIEIQVNKLKESGGYGDISIAISMTKSVVDRGEIMMSIRRLYVPRKNNRIIDSENKEV